MTPVVFDDVVAAGADWDLVYLDTDDDGTATDFTGCNAELQVRRTPSASVSLLTLTSTPHAGITIDPTAGRIDFHFTPAQTAALALGRYTYQVELYWPSGRVDRIIEGVLKVTQEGVR